MFEERNIQWFCTEEQFSANEGLNKPITLKNLELLPEKKWDDFEIACKQDSDCPKSDLG